MNLLRINKEIRPVYWVDNFLSTEEIDKILKYAEQTNPVSAKVGGNIQEEEKKPFTPDYHIKNPNVGESAIISSNNHLIRCKSFLISN